MFADVPKALAEIRAGRMVIVVDDEDRENEGDLTLAAEYVSPEAINFMAKFGPGSDLPHFNRGTGRLSTSRTHDAGEHLTVRHCLH